MTIIINNWKKIIFILSFFAIFFALTAEYIYNLSPCKMCLYQRYPYYFILLVFVVFYFFKKLSSLWLFIMVELAILYGLFYSVWHVGIEKKIFSGPEGCSAFLNKSNSIENLKDQILKQDVIDCSEVTWIIFGFSAATINSILLLLFLYFNSIFIIKKFYEKEKI